MSEQEQDKLPYLADNPTPEQWEQLRVGARDNETPINLREIRLAWELLHEHRLVVRPAIVGEGWYCGRFKCAYLDGVKIEYEKGTVAYAATLQLAVYYASLKVIEKNRQE